MNATLSFAANAMHGTLQGEDRDFDGVSTDSRTIREGELFIALSGPNFDGSKFVSQACGKGAAGAVVAALVKDDIAQITVEDTRLALGQLGKALLEQSSATVIGITGSNGKTTLKEMIAACLASVAPTLATDGNLNNDIGMPLMMARVDKSHQYVVLEMGANHAGEIAYLTSLAKPDVVAISNAAAAHLEGFGSVEGVARAKAEILLGEPRPKTAVLNSDDEYYSYWMSLVDGIRVLSFGLNDDADIRADRIETGTEATHFTLHLPDATMDLSLPLAGVHNVRNACAAAAIAAALDVPHEKIKEALENVRPVAGRLQALQGIKGATLYDDSYNANPLSVIAAAEFLASLSGVGLLVLGDMAELGDDAVELHRDVGASIRSAGISRLITFGELSRAAAKGFGDGASSYDELDALVHDVTDILSADTNVLIKGSRSMRM
ncbi:MAG: UDP-N-acetylmuramoyl-tripeptide--D-alanyl-D-alanine ligase, partial [Gammaproteobacteria bacterium]|nr:UDP-N-acetylmuramoyl-tripeptide--D-alanyl-D-alanine ligase [Gammaproteobacteria bacterium]